MGMYLQYGNYRHAVGECAVQILRTPIWQHGIVTHIREEWVIAGRMQQPTPDTLSYALAALQLAYKFNGGDLGLFFDTGDPTVHALLSINCIGGTRVTYGPAYEMGKGAEYSTFRNYSIRVEGNYANMAASLIYWKERIQIRGGGPHTVYLELRQGYAQKQVPTQQVTYKAIQHGEAIGQYGFVNPAPPIWQQALKQDESEGIGRETPDRIGPGGITQYMGYRTTWGYTFESTSPLVGVPTMWPA